MNTTNKQKETKQPKLHYCENCDLNFSSKESNAYKVTCPYCNNNLNKEMLDSYYSFLNIPEDIPNNL